MEKKGENLHKGHRQRLKARFIDEGLAHFDDVNILEMLLFYSVPQRDTNEMAHRLIERFKTLDGVFDASVDELTSVQGITEHSAVLINFVAQSYIRYSQSKLLKASVSMDNVSAAGEFASATLMNKTNECFLVICLNTKLKLMHHEILFEGSVDRASVDTRRIAELALRKKCSSVIIAHNHPSGSLEPSEEDIRLTAAVADTLKAVRVEFNDHIICCGNEYLSLAQDTDYSLFFD